MIRARVLGSAAGGGLPQWNCGCVNCTCVRTNDGRVTRRTQDSIAIGTGAGDRWLLVNASPDVLRQIDAFDALWPRGRRDTPIAAVALTNGDLDHVLGLFSLREWQPLRVLASTRVRDGLVDHNAMFRTLARTSDQVAWDNLMLGQEVAVEDVGVGVTAFAVHGKLPVHLVGVTEPSPEDNVALRIRDLAGDGPSLVVATSVGSLDGIDVLLDGAAAVFVDGTFWSDDELLLQGLGAARASDMAHVPVGGKDGTLARLARVRAARRVYTHINNTNPMLRGGSPERAAVEQAGWEIAFDGMEISL
ncbi:MAG: pyrroloquinoline quinone biosynthesis protein PqqB [Myxococcota bacterium]|nr:pyrroloquinoline quinone biosynthesis protein PqqB [Myxococcota bacterium]